MKKLLVMCGSGIATSTVVVGKVKQWLKDNGYEDKVQVFQSKVSEEVNVVPDSVKDKVIMGLPLLTGMGIDSLWNELKQALEA